MAGVFSSIARWFDSLQEDSRLFERPDDAQLHAALAAVLYHFIKADGRASSREQHYFKQVMREQCGLDDTRAEALYATASATASGDVRDDLHTVNAFLKRNPAVRMQFMKCLVRLVHLDGARDEELEVFYGALHEVFPDLDVRA